MFSCAVLVMLSLLCVLIGDVPSGLRDVIHDGDDRVTVFAGIWPILTACFRRSLFLYWCVI